MVEDDKGQGRVYGERYEIKRRIARGGMADVYLAQDKLLDRPVALKVLFAELSVDPSFVERFRREAQNAAKLSHPNIVSVYDWGEDDNTYYIVMEYIDGRSLATVLRENGSLPADRAAGIGAEVASALAFAHRNGVIHRDVKPGNVLIDERGAVKVTDFGIARARNTTENLTQTGAVMGTATYFSPEQAQGQAVDQRSDVYSLGVVLYEMAAGKAPFSGDNPVTIALQHVRETPPALRSINPGIPPAFVSITEQAMAKTPAARYASAEDLRLDLDRFLRSQPVVAATAAMPDATAAIPVTAVRAAYADATAVTPTVRRPTPPPPIPEDRSLKSPFLILLGLLALVLLGGLFLLNAGANSGGEPVAVPAVTSRPVAEAQTMLRDAGLRSEVTRQESDQPEGTVLTQNPPAGTTVPASSVVRLTVSEGPAPIDLPDVTGRSFDQARTTLTALGLTVQRSEANSDNIAEGNVISQSPQSGSEVQKGDTITLTVSTGARQTKVPNVVGFTQEKAAEQLSEAGLRTNSVTEASDQPTGTVIKTDPPAGRDVDRNTVVTITVSSGRPVTTTTTTTTTPDDEEADSGGGKANGKNG